MIYPKNTSGFEVYCEMEKNGRATLDTRHGTETNKRRRRKTCGIDYMLVK
jgi:hypothetical protein